MEDIDVRNSWIVKHMFNSNVCELGGGAAAEGAAPPRAGALLGGERADNNMKTDNDVRCGSFTRLCQNGYIMFA